MTQRSEQVAATLKRAIQKILSKGLSDPRVKGLVTITRLDVSPDLGQAIVYCSVTPHKHHEITMHGVSSAAIWIRREASELVRFRKMPKFTFKIDDQLQRQQEVLASIAEARQEDERREKNKSEDS